MQQSEHERRIREVWETTQENLETAVGTAYSRWTNVNNHYVNPTVESISSCTRGCFSCFPDTRRRPGSHRRNSMDFFDMYDEEGEFGRDELDRLISEDQIDGYDDFGPEDPVYERQPEGAARPGSINEHSGASGGAPAISHVLRDTKKSFLSIFGSLMPLWAQPPSLRYKPSTAGLRGVRPANRSRSSTKSSVQSSETFRSRTDLFSDEEYEDAQMVSDNFAAALVFGRSRGGTMGSRSSLNSGKNSADTKSIDSRRSDSTKSIRDPAESSAAATAAAAAKDTTKEISEDRGSKDETEALKTTTSSSASLTTTTPTSTTVIEIGATDEELRAEEAQAELEEEREIEQNRRAAQTLAANKGLQVAHQPSPTP
ncbi:hypothetical protein AWJ20_4145 [Sugiyamaella lignohabitans]|uniref:Uncharacterized protein n=1 Tax=Sugiyamaella lignohabitans TaxID=796027 RepID=A0A167C823_9ASCO|nr:uncharacterized protein AWJ20_4145 [Sugiyamaella lignohabitans]ANB11340.1 hypothetical protein AWJ20_4145 [Sugiyamaella lignohabitans]